MLNAFTGDEKDKLKRQGRGKIKELTNPSPPNKGALIYVDSADGKVKVIHKDGTIETFVMI